MTFDLPDFNTPLAIEPTNIEALGVLYAAFQFEEMRFFDVVDRLVDRFMSGQLPIGQSGAATMLAAHARARAEHLPSASRRQIYCRALGLACGSASDGPAPNREFNDLWARFVDAVSSFVNELQASTAAPTQSAVGRAGRDLASNLSLRGYGIGHDAARELQRQLSDAVQILSDPEVLAAMGARHMWQLVQRVAETELGGAPDIVRHRTQASAGTVIMRWLAQRAWTLSADGTADVLDIDMLRRARPSPTPPTLTPTPTDVDLVSACEHWLAVTTC